MTWEKASLQDLMSGVGIKSSGDDLDGIDLSTRTTSVSVTGKNSDIDLPLDG
jgi:hypothetical protein